MMAHHTLSSRGGRAADPARYSGDVNGTVAGMIGLALSLRLCLLLPRARSPNGAIFRIQQSPLPGVASAARTSKLGDAPNRASSDPRCRRRAPNLR
jgi:hypothetical protein